MRIRPYEVGDKVSCLAICASNVPTFYRLAHRDAFETHLDSVARKRANQPFSIRVIEEDGALVACGTFAQSPALGAGESAFIGWFMVHAEHHGRGLGRLLLTALMNEISRRPDVSVVKLEATQHSAGFYQRAGFRVARSARNGFGDDLHKYSMEFVLDSGSRRELSDRWAEERA